MFRRIAAVARSARSGRNRRVFLQPARRRPRAEGPPKRRQARRWEARSRRRVRAEPTTFNRFVSNGFPTHLVSLLTDGRLVRVNPADRSARAVAGRARHPHGHGAWTSRCAPGLRFSDGTPATADDVVWSLKAAYATAQGGIGDGLRIDGAEIQARAESPTRVVLTLPRPWATADRLLEALPIYPRAVIEPALAAGTFADACSTSAPCPGLGPFVVARYDAGQRVVLARNPHYWRTDAAGATRCRTWTASRWRSSRTRTRSCCGSPAGRPTCCSRSCGRKTSARCGPTRTPARVVVTDVGPGLDRHVLWFNLGPAPIDPAKAFLRQDAFRQAVSLAVDRTGFANTVFLGAADAVVRAGVGGQQGVDRRSICRGPRSTPRRRRRCSTAWSCAIANNDGLREDAVGPSRALRGAGAVGHHGGADGDGLRARRAGQRRRRPGHRRAGPGHGDGPAGSRGKYDAVFHYIQVSDTDPASNLDFWLSRGSGHLWHPGQATPATPWEAEIDRRMLLMASTIDQAARVREFAEVQRLMLTHNPAIWFAAPRVFVATRPRVGGAAPRLTRPQVLWTADELYVVN